MKIKNIQAVLILFIGLAVNIQADVAVFDFSGESHGTVISNNYESTSGVTFSAVGGLDIAMIYDSEVYAETGSDGRDEDMQRTASAGKALLTGWSGGNLSAIDNEYYETDYIAGGVLIIQEDNPGFEDEPDDNGSGGLIIMDIDSDNWSYQTFGLTLVDHEEAASGWTFTLYGANGSNGVTTLETIMASDPTIQTGDNFINVLPAFDSTAFGIDKLSKVEISMNGSGGFGVIAFGETIEDIESALPAVPEPAAMGLISLGGVFTLAIARFRRRNQDY